MRIDRSAERRTGNIEAIKQLFASTPFNPVDRLIVYVSANGVSNEAARPISLAPDSTSVSV